MLTCLRVALACGLFAMLSVWTYASSPAAAGAAAGGGIDWFLVAAAALFVVAAVTDALDGYLARRWGAISVFGRIMDPFADKILVIGSFMFMAAAPFWSGAEQRQVSGVHAWMVAVILGRELLVTSIRGAMEGMGVSFAASWSGKLKMILQSIVVPCVLVLLATAPALPGARADAPPSWMRGVIDVLVWTTVMVTAWSGLPYVTKAIQAAGGRGPAGNRTEAKG